MILFYDVETNGLPDWRAPSDAPHQPHLVQFAALLTDDVGRERCSTSLIVYPQEWTISDDLAKLHGINMDTAREFGVSEKYVVDLFIAWAEEANLRVAHNLSFDDRLMRIAAVRAHYERKQIEDCEKRPSFCTMQKATHIVNLPPTEKMVAAGFNKPKSPKLSECIKHFFDEELPGAHDALVDVRACARLYFHLRSLTP